MTHNYKPEWHYVTEAVVRDWFDKYNRWALDSVEMLTLIDELNTMLLDFAPFNTDEVRMEGHLTGFEAGIEYHINKKREYQMEKQRESRARRKAQEAHE